jgi:Domain of unknown function (DUF5666)
MTTQSPQPPPNPTEFDDDLVPITDIEPDPALVGELQRRRAVTPLTRSLLVLVIAGGAFLGGVLVERSQAKTTPSSALPSGVSANIAALFGGARTSTTVAGAGGTTGASSTFGTVKLVDGKNVYVSDAQGNVVKVATNATTKITTNQPASIAKLKPSTTVIVQGTTAADGTLTATSISQSTPGGGLSTGRLPSFGGGAVPGAGATP